MHLKACLHPHQHQACYSVLLNSSPDRHLPPATSLQSEIELGNVYIFINISKVILSYSIIYVTYSLELEMSVKIYARLISGYGHVVTCVTSLDYIRVFALCQVWLNMMVEHMRQWYEYSMVLWHLVLIFICIWRSLQEIFIVWP